MRRRLRVTLAMAAMLLLLHTVSAVTQTIRSEQTSPQAVVTVVSASEGVPRAVPPVGWRRTATGWQHVSTWAPLPVPRISLAERVTLQRDAEPVWLRELTGYLRRTPPGCFALAQLSGVALLFLFFSCRVTKRVHRTGDTSFVSQSRLAR